MNKNTFRDAVDHALREYPRESCGLVVVTGRKESYFPCRNMAEDRGGDFVMNSLDVLAAEEKGDITMLVHSHPDASPRPSPSDIRGCENSELPWCILSVQGDGTENAVFTGSHVFQPTGFEIPLRGREFIFGEQDCYTLVQDFYKREMNIVLPDMPRKDKFWERGENIIMEHYEEWGFEKIPEPTQRGDVILMAIRSDIVNHNGIWLAEADHMLHHPYGHLSEKTVYGGYWAENTRMFARKVR